MARIFLTGATGYIGGDALHAIHKSHPEYTIAALARDATKAKQISKDYPNVRIVSGSLEDTALITTEASKADIVLHLAATSHLQSAQAILRGLTDGRRERPAHWIQISGATLLASPQIADKTFGEPSDKVYNDLSGVEDIRGVIKRYPNRAVDNLVLDASAQTQGINTALVVGPVIFGDGRGPGNKRSIQVPEMARTTIQRGKGWYVGKGLSAWDNVHVQDLSNIFLRLVEKAIESDTLKPYWNQDGIYFATVGHLSFLELSRTVAKVAYEQGHIKSKDVESLQPEEADKLTGHAAILLGTNARCESSRARELLGWKPIQKSLEEEIPETVRQESSKYAGDSKV